MEREVINRMEREITNGVEWAREVANGMEREITK
jgi:hypothetical protein